MQPCIYCDFHMARQVINYFIYCVLIAVTPWVLRTPSIAGIGLGSDISVNFTGLTSYRNHLCTIIVIVLHSISWTGLVWFSGGSLGNKLMTWPIRLYCEYDTTRFCEWIEMDVISCLTLFLLFSLSSVSWFVCNLSLPWHFNKGWQILKGKYSSQRYSMKP